MPVPSYAGAHARRKFNEALANDKGRAAYALSEIQKLYAIERYLPEHEFTADKERKNRQEHVVPILKEVESWLKQEYAKVFPASAIGVAIAYSLKRWDKHSL